MKLKNHLKIFISSTFQDMEEEREILLKKTFLELKKIAKKRAVEITEIDLRTGITQEQEQSGEIVKICLDEIERCKDSPIFFLGILGNRYGWQEWHLHTDENTLKDKKYSWVTSHIGKSVTELEIVSAIERNKKDNRAFIYLKDGKDDNPKLTELKNRLIIKSENSQNIEVLHYKDSSEFREKTIESFTKALDELYPKDEKISEVEKLRSSHQIFAKSRQKIYITHAKNESILSEFIVSDQDRLLLYGESGYGKSALIANYFEKFKKSSDSFVIEHYIGGAGELSNDLHQMLRRIMLEIKEEFDLSDEVPSEPQKIMDEFALWLHRVKRPTIIVFDGYNQIEDEMKEKLFYYIPDKLERVKLIITAIKDNYPIDNKYKIEPLTKEEQEKLVVDYLKEYGKEGIALKIQNQITKHPQTDNTLFLRTLLNEIRLLGDFDNVEKDIANYLQAKDLVELFIEIFERLESDYRENLAKEVLSLLYVSRDGLSEDNLMEIINQNSTKKLTRLEFSPLFLAVEEHLIDRGGLYGFFHDYIREALKNRYLNSEELVNVERRKIADYFEGGEIDNQRVRELPFQLYELKDKERLYNNLIDIDFFIFLFDTNIYELLKYFRYVSINFNIVSLLQNIVENDIYKDSLNIRKLAVFFHIYYPEYNKSMIFFKKILNLNKLKYGENHLKLVNCFTDIAELYFTVSEYDLSVEYYYKALSIQQDKLDVESMKLAETYHKLAHVYKYMGNHKESLKFHFLSLNIKENNPMVKKDDLLFNYNDLSELYQSISQYDNALVFVEKAIRLSIIFFGENHPKTALYYSNLGLFYYYTGEYDKSIEIQLKDLEITKKYFGENHIYTAVCYNNIGLSTCEKGDYDKSIFFHKKALKIKKIFFDEDNHEVLQSYNNLGYTFLEKEDYPNTLKYYLKSLYGRKSFNGTYHPETAMAYNNLGYYYFKIKNCKQALVFYKKALKINIKIYDKFHEDVARSYNNIAVLYEKVRKYEKALPLHLKVLNRRKKIFGMQNLHTAQSFNNLATCFLSLEKNYTAIALYKKAIKIREKKLGEEHVYTANSYNSIALSYYYCSQYEDAYYYINKAIKIRKKVLVKNHTDLLKSESILKMIQQSLEN